MQKLKKASKSFKGIKSDLEHFEESKQNLILKYLNSKSLPRKAKKARRKILKMCWYAVHETEIMYKYDLVHFG